MRLPRLLLVLPLVLVLAGTARAEEVRLTVLHTTDLHGALTDYDYLNDRPAARGLVRIASLVRAARAAGGPVLLLDAGDCIQGSPLETVYRADSAGIPEPMMTAMTRMGYDAMAVGNHEFDYGLQALERTHSQAGFPWLAANIVHSGDGTCAFTPSLVKILDGVRVGVVGLCTPAVPSFVDSARWAGLRFLSPVEVARREVERLRREERCDVVMLLAHTGLERDPVTGAERRGDIPDENWGWRLATGVPGLDVVVLAHTHLLVSGAEVGGVLVTQAGKSGEALGRVELTLARATAGGPWKLVKREARVIAVADSTPVDGALAAFAAPYHEVTQRVLSEVVSGAARDLDAPRGRFEPGPLWELLQRAQADAGGVEVSLAALPDPEARIPAGLVTRRDLWRAAPYENTLGVVEMTGAELKETLERGARYLAAYTYEDGRPLAEPGMPAYNFDAAFGVSYDVDLTRPAGDRVLNLSYHGAPLGPEYRIKVAVNSYRLNGGGGFEEVQRAPRLWRSEATVPELLVAYARRMKTLDGTFTRNWTLLPDYASSPERPLIDLLVRQGVAPRAEVQRLGPDEAARRGDLVYWLGRAFGWRARKFSDAFPDVPDSLVPWLDGLLQHRVLGGAATLDRFRPFGIVPLSLTLEWCEAAARSAGYALPRSLADLSFRRSLLTGISFRGPPRPADRDMVRDSLTRAEVLGIVSNTRFPVLRVLETTDFHGAILPGARDRRSGRPWGGSAVLAAYLGRLRAANPEGTILLDGGDCFQGTMISNLQFGRPVVEQMNRMGYAGMAIGNHDFDWGVDTLEARIREMRFGAYGANIKERKSDRLPRWARADTLLVRRGVRIGVLGLGYTRTPTVTLPLNVAHLRFDDDSAAAARLAPRLRRQQGAEVVLALGHVPAETDSTRHVRGDLARLAKGVKGVDAWFGGHSHNLVMDEPGGVPTMIAGALGQWVGVCDLVVDPLRDRVVEHRMQLVPTYADEVVPDSAMQAEVARWNTAVAAIAATPVGRNAARLGRERGGESTVGNLVADAMRVAVGADVALQNSGGLRADLKEGPLTRGDLYEVMPFDNTVVTMELTGTELRRVLEEGLRYGRVTQVSGIRYRFDPDLPELSRVTSLTLADGAPVDSARTYRVACNNFMAGGGDNYNTLSRGRHSQDTGVVVREALEKLVIERCQGGAALDYRPEGRVQRGR